MCPRFLLSLALAAASAMAGQTSAEMSALLQQCRQEIAQGNFSAAETDLNTVIENARAKNLVMHEFMAYELFSSINEKQNDLEAAEQWLNKAPNLFSGSATQLPSLVDLQVFYARHKFYGKEADALSKIIGVWSTVVGPDSIGVARYRGLLGTVYFSMGQDADAESSLLAAIAILEKRGMGSSDACDAVRRNLLKVLMKEGKRADVAALIPVMHPDPPKRERPDVYPRMISKLEAQYSEEARKLKVSGSVSISLEVDEKGIPTNLKVVGPLGLGLDERALATVSTWRFEPGTLSGKPVVTPAVVEVNFRLL